MANAQHHALLVQDEPGTREVLRVHLAAAGFHVEETADGRHGLNRTREVPFDLILLDATLPGLDGVTLCRAVRAEERNRQTPIMMLSARNTESDAVIALDSGADDYLAQPFGMREMLARVGAVMRRNARAQARRTSPSRVAAHGLVLDRDRRETVIDGKPVVLTKQEFDLLHQLASRPGVVFSRSTLLQCVWKEDVFVTERTVDTVISRLRRKIESDPQRPSMLLTAWGVGYKFADVD